MAFYNQSAPEPPLPPMKRLWKKFLTLMAYPFKVGKMISGYNAGVGEIMIETGDYSLDEYRTVNNKFLYSLIYLPILLGVISTALMIYTNEKAYDRYFSVMTSSTKNLTMMESISRKTKFAIKEFPVKTVEIAPILIGFLIALGGARFLSYHPAFAEIAKIQEDLKRMNFVDKDGNPWRVVWTIDAILFISYGYDPMKFVQEQRFWATINFSPGPPKVSKTNMNKFVVQRKYELSANMVFEFGEKEIAKIDAYVKSRKDD